MPLGRCELFGRSLWLLLEVLSACDRVSGKEDDVKGDSGESDEERREGSFCSLVRSLAGLPNGRMFLSRPHRLLLGVGDISDSSDGKVRSFDGGEYWSKSDMDPRDEWRS